VTGNSQKVSWIGTISAHDIDIVLVAIDDGLPSFTPQRVSGEYVPHRPSGPSRHRNDPQRTPVGLLLVLRTTPG
jgi:hypothetical protein